MLPWILGGAALGATSLLSGLFGVSQEKKRRRREARETISDLERQRAGELEQLSEDVNFTYSTAESDLAAGGVKSSYLPELKQQRLTRGSQNIYSGYGGMIDSVARAGGLPWRRPGRSRL